jgi:Protein of unknown function (DUF998)
MTAPPSSDLWLGRRSGRARLEALGGGLVGLFAACAYSSFVLEKALGSPLNPAHAYVSELGARSQPATAFFRVSDVLAGAGLIVLAWALLRWLPADWRCRLGCGAIAVMGAASVVAGAKPLACTPSADVVCRLRDRTDPLAQLHQAHVASSMIGFLGAVMGMLLLGSLLRDVSCWRWLGRLGTVGAFLATGLAVLELALTLLPGLWVGLPERAETLLESAWYGALALRLIADAWDHTTRCPRPPGSARRRRPGSQGVKGTGTARGPAPAEGQPGRLTAPRSTPGEPKAFCASSVPGPGDHEYTSWCSTVAL